jgi:hypothetical protein
MGRDCARKSDGDGIAQDRVGRARDVGPGVFEALEDTFELDVFSPIRQDWLGRTDEEFEP